MHALGTDQVKTFPHIFFKERRRRKKHYILLYPDYSYIDIPLPPAGLRIQQLPQFCSLGHMPWIARVKSSYPLTLLHTKRAESHLKQTSQYTLVWQRIYLKSNRKQLCNFSLKSILPVALCNRNLGWGQGVDNSLKWKDLGEWWQKARKTPKPQTLSLEWQIAYNFPLFLLTPQLWVLHLHVSWRNTSTALILSI